MDYSGYRSEDAARLRQHDERIQLLREQRELGQQILKEMDSRDAHVAALDELVRDRRQPLHSTVSREQEVPRRQNGLTTPDSTATAAHAGPPRPSRRREPTEGDTKVDSSSDTQIRGRKRSLPQPSDDGSSDGEDFVPARRPQPRGDPASKKYPLFSSNENYTSIVKVDDRIVELACAFCRGNYFKSWKGGYRYLHGVQGVQKHIHMSHPDEHERIRFSRRPFFEWVSKNCVRRVLTEEEKEDVRNGRYYVNRIEIRTDKDKKALPGDEGQ